MNITNEEIKTEFIRQVKLCAGIGRAAMINIVNDRFPICPEHFLFDENKYLCVGNDEGKYWAEVNGISKGFDKGDCIIETELKISRDTLPKDGQLISFQTQDEDWHDGYFIDGDDLFLINESKWYNSWNVLKWREV